MEYLRQNLPKKGDFKKAPKEGAAKQFGFAAPSFVIYLNNKAEFVFQFFGR